jgi:uncharacterized protein YbaR (Trm112 family)/SAM-dependent methyltransferase
MKSSLLNYICCLSCKNKLRLNIRAQEKGEVLEGDLICEKCNATYPIIKGVPRFMPLKITKTVKGTVDSFGFEWNYFTDKLETFKKDSEFLSLIPPVTPSFFKDKIVLDAGCGMGRLCRLSASYGAREIIGVDLSNSVEAAFAYTKELPNVHIIQCDLHSIPLKEKVDFVYSLGVLHHLPDGFDGFRALSSHIKNEGGTIAFWVYGKEGNNIMRVIQVPLRFITTRLDFKMKLILSRLLTGCISLGYRLFYLPLNRTPLKRVLYYSDYMRYFHTLGFRDRQSTVFDFLSTPIVKYYSRAELIKWVNEAGLKLANIHWRNRNSWGVVATYQATNFREGIDGGGAGG